MMSQLFNHVLPEPKSYQEEFASIPVPGTLTSDYIKPDKSQFIYVEDGKEVFFSEKLT